MIFLLYTIHFYHHNLHWILSRVGIFWKLTIFQWNPGRQACPFPAPCNHSFSFEFMNHATATCPTNRLKIYINIKSCWAHGYVSFLHRIWFCIVLLWGQSVPKNFLTKYLTDSTASTEKCGSQNALSKTSDVFIGNRSSFIEKTCCPGSQVYFCSFSQGRKDLREVFLQQDKHPSDVLTVFS